MIVDDPHLANFRLSPEGVTPFDMEVEGAPDASDLEVLDLQEEDVIRALEHLRNQ